MAVFRVEKTKDFTVMSNCHLRDERLSLKAKGLQSLMLSLPEDWDYTTKGLAMICKDGVDSVCTALKELENLGYLTRRRIRDDHGRVGDIEYIIHEVPESTVTKRDSPKRENPNQENPKQDKPRQGKQLQSNTNRLNTNKSETNQSIDPNEGLELSLAVEPDKADKIDQMDEKDRVKAYLELIHENIDYDYLLLNYDKERVDQVVDLILDVVLSKRTTMRIAKDEYPTEIVKSRLLKLNASHLKYVFSCLDENTTKIENIKAYLLTALYNAPATMDSYYRAKVNHDLYGAR